ncbi:MAG: hypothetical protein ABSG18_26800, partial [Steroidobacteraceae bacterium]
AFDFVLAAIFYIPCWISNVLAAIIVTRLAPDDSDSSSEFAPRRPFQRLGADIGYDAYFDNSD